MLSRKVEHHDRSSAAAEDLELDLIEGDILRLLRVVGEHAGLDPVLDGLGHRHTLHIAIEELVVAGDLVNEGKVVQVDASLLLLRLLEAHEDLRAVLLHVHDQVFEIFLVDLKVLHDHVVCQSIPLVPELPVVHVVVEGLLILAVQMYAVPGKVSRCEYLQVERHHKEHRCADGGVDVAADVLVIERNVAPGSGACEVGSH